MPLSAARFHVLEAPHGTCFLCSSGICAPALVSPHRGDSAQPGAVALVYSPAAARPVSDASPTGPRAVPPTTPRRSGRRAPPLQRGITLTRGAAAHAVAPVLPGSA